MSSWVCYLIRSLNSNRTYVGSTNNMHKRLNAHNRGSGAKATAGQTWIPVVIMSGFHHKNACLSFESGWKRLSKKRNEQRLDIINRDCEFKYIHREVCWNRIMDLLYFVHKCSLVDTHYKLNTPENGCGHRDLILHIFTEPSISELPWPDYIHPNVIDV